MQIRSVHLRVCAFHVPDLWSNMALDFTQWSERWIEWDVGRGHHDG